MPNQIVLQINDELTDLQKELSKFKTTIDYLNTAKEAVEDAVQKVNLSESHFDTKVKELKSAWESVVGLNKSVGAVMTKLDTINFPERLDNIEKTIKLTILSLNETKDQTIDEVRKASEHIIKADFETKFNNLNELIDSSVKANNKLAYTIEHQHLGEKIVGLEKGVTKRIHESYKEIEKHTLQISIDSAKAITELNLPLRIDKLDATISGILASIQNLQGRLDLIERNISDKLKDSNDKQNTFFKTLEEKLLMIEKSHKTREIITWILITISIMTILFYKN